MKHMLLPWKWLLLGAAVLLVIIVMSQISLLPDSASNTAGQNAQQLAITQIKLGSMKGVALISKDAYTVGEPLALRVQTADPAPETFQVTIRLLTERGEIKPLAPATVTFTKKKDTYCCWVVNEPGIYKLQVFRPDQRISSFALTIQKL